MPRHPTPQSARGQKREPRHRPSTLQLVKGPSPLRCSNIEGESDCLTTYIIKVMLAFMCVCVCVPIPVYVLMCVHVCLVHLCECVFVHVCMCA